MDQEKKRRLSDLIRKTLGMKDEDENSTTSTGHKGPSSSSDTGRQEVTSNPIQETDSNFRPVHFTITLMRFLFEPEKGRSGIARESSHEEENLTGEIGRGICRGFNVMYNPCMPKKISKQIDKTKRIRYAEITARW